MKKKVLIGMLILGASIIIADILLVVKGLPTISGTVLYYTLEKHWHIFPYVMGLLSGHFFIPNRKIHYFDTALKIGIGITVPYIIIQILASTIGLDPVVTLIASFPIGIFVWGQEWKS